MAADTNRIDARSDRGPRIDEVAASGASPRAARLRSPARKACQMTCMSTKAARQGDEREGARQPRPGRGCGAAVRAAPEFRTFTNADAAQSDEQAIAEQRQNRLRVAGRRPDAHLGQEALERRRSLAGVTGPISSAAARS